MDSGEYLGPTFSLKGIFPKDPNSTREHVGLDFSMPKSRKVKSVASSGVNSAQEETFKWRLNPMEAYEAPGRGPRKAQHSLSPVTNSRYGQHQDSYFGTSYHAGHFHEPPHHLAPASSTFQSPYHPMPRPLPAPVNLQLLAKPKPRKSRQTEFQQHHGDLTHMFAMPPPIAEFSGGGGGEEFGAKKKTGAREKEKEKEREREALLRKRSKSSSGKPDLAGSKTVGVSSRWRAVTDAHHTRLMDLIKLKPGEEAEFEEELSNNPVVAGKLKVKKSGWRSGKGVPAQRLSALRFSKVLDLAEPSTSHDDSSSDRQNVKVIAKLRMNSSPEERFRKPQSGNPDWEIFEQYYGAKKRILTTLKRAKPLTLMRRPERERPSKLNTVLSQKPTKAASTGRSHSSGSPYPASEWGHAAFTPTGKIIKRKRQDEQSLYEDELLSSLPSLTSTPSHAESDWQNSDVEADESRKKILTQLQKLNDKRARLEAQLTKIQKNNVPDGLFPNNAALQPSSAARISEDTRFLQRKLVKRPRAPQDLVREQWKIISQKFIPLAFRLRLVRREEISASRSKIVAACIRDHTENRIESDRLAAECIQRAKFMVRDMSSRWKIIDKEEKKFKKLVEKAEAEQKRVDLEMQETRRQQRKLNFLITQTELYAHFMGKKISGSGDQDTAAASAILHGLDKEETVPEFEQRLEPLEGQDETEGLVGDEAKKDVMRNVEEAFQANKNRVLEFNKKAGLTTEQSAVKTVATSEKVLSEPEIFHGKLKGYQKKGITWLASLFSNGINGILADEMGLGKTVQSIAFLGHVAEEHGIWGPFLIVAPASTLHNWQQEFHRFVPEFKAVPYWGTTDERKILRQFWKADKMHTQQASFHVVITSYQLIVQDAPYLKKINWQYMILDEAQAIKSSTSIRWKLLLDFPCRNRLLLTGTPIQNSMAELWALLHFIMPSLFDSHDEFNEWFSKDIESHAENKSQMDDKHLSRLHMILKPFMMRRIKRDVEEELGDKIEIMVNCPLTRRQQILYEALKHKISIEDLLYSSTSTSSQSETTSSLMNLVMHFRKVCNHPELFERRDIRSPLSLPGLTFSQPKLVYRECSPKNRQAGLDYLIQKYFSLASPLNVKLTTKEAEKSNGDIRSVMSFCQFFPLATDDVRRIFSDTIFWRLKVWKELRRKKLLARHCVDWSARGTATSQRNLLMLDPFFSTSDDLVDASMQKFIIADNETGQYSYGPCRIHYTVETLERKYRKTELIEVESFTAADASQGSEPEAEEPRQPRVVEYFPLWIPSFFHCVVPKALSRSIDSYVRDRSAESENLLLTTRNSQVKLRELIWHGVPDGASATAAPSVLRSEKPGGLLAVRPDIGWSPMEIPDKQHLIVDSGKLRVLDSLLHRLKDEGHRVLIYSLMTKMMDILEEFMIHKHYPYIRLDGSSKISERRDLVKDFQSRDDIFVFLLSTRAGGLGINLTAADTVIFYDSDWNPTVDQQAMDRAHRLGQTKQVTVYRLICRNTVEERILERAQEKSEIQRMVISGGDYRPDTLRPTEVVSLLLDDDEIKATLKRRENEMRTREQNVRNVVAKAKPSTKRSRSTSAKPPAKKVKKPTAALTTPLSKSTSGTNSKAKSKTTKSKDSASVDLLDSSSQDALVLSESPAAAESKKKKKKTSVVEKGQIPFVGSILDQLDGGGVAIPEATLVTNGQSPSRKPRPKKEKVNVETAGKPKGKLTRQKKTVASSSSLEISSAAELNPASADDGPDLS